MGTGASGKRVQFEEKVCARQRQGSSLEGRESKGKKKRDWMGSSQFAPASGSAWIGGLPLLPPFGT